MKKKIFTLTLVLLLALCVALTACQKTPEGTGDDNTPDQTDYKIGYSFLTTTGTASHTGLAMGKVVVEGGYITEIVLDEIYFPLEWARMNEEDVATLGTANVVTNGAATSTVTCPKYLRFDGVMYTGYRVAIGTDQLSEATSSTGIRYFTAAPNAEGTVKSLETKLGEDMTLAKKYYAILKSNDLSKIKYSKTAAGAAADLVDVVRSNAAVEGKVRLGAATAGLTGRNLAYASGFFKGETNYTPGNAVVDGTAVIGRNATWNQVAANFVKAVQTVGLANITQEMINGMTTTALTATSETGGAKLGTVETGASVANYKYYVQVIWNAYRAAI